MSANEYNENSDKKNAVEEAAAADALAALSGSGIDKSTKKRKPKTTSSITGDDGKGKNKYVSEDEKSENVAAKKEETENEKKSDKKNNKPEKKSRLFSGRTFVQIMNGEFLTKDNVVNNLPFTFFIGFLLIILIAWGYYGETVTKKEIQLEKELGELNSEYFTLTADYNMQRGRREIANRLAHTGVKESQTSPKKIRVRKYVFNNGR